MFIYYGGDYAPSRLWIGIAIVAIITLALILAFDIEDAAVIAKHLAGLP